MRRAERERIIAAAEALADTWPPLPDHAIEAAARLYVAAFTEPPGK